MTAAAPAVAERTPVVRLVSASDASSRWLVGMAEAATTEVMDADGCRVRSRNPAMSWAPAPPALLISFAYLRTHRDTLLKLHMRSLALDCGAFTARNQGTTVDLGEYMDAIRWVRSTGAPLTEVFALDVIGNWKGTLANTERMWADGVQAIPTWHQGEPIDALHELARRFPKVAIGGVAHQAPKLKRAWARAVLGRVWPKRVHGFGFGDARTIMEVPFHSSDASSWFLAPQGFGNMVNPFGRTAEPRLRRQRQCTHSGAHVDIRGEVLHYLDIERRARHRWAAEMKLLEDCP